MQPAMTARRTGSRSRRPALAAPLAASLLAAAMATGCSAEQVYNAAQGWRRNECYKIADLAQRERCLIEADRPYDAYRAGSAPAR